MESWAQLTAPVEVPVVLADEHAAAGRTEPDLLALHVAAALVGGDRSGVTPAGGARGCPAPPCRWPAPPQPSQSTIIVANSTQPCRRSFTSRP